MKSGVPREVINPCGCLEEEDRRVGELRLALRNLPCHAGDLQIIEPAGESAFDALGEKFLEH